MKILVTGANGYLGSKMTTKLLDLGHDVIAVDFQIDHIDSRAKIFTKNIFDGTKGLYHFFGEPDVCLHMAWRDGFKHNSENHILDLSNHFLFLKNLIDDGIKQIAVMGSMHEIGYHEGIVDEITSTNPQTFYAIAKDSLRRSLNIYCKDKNVVFQWLRGFYVYGNDEIGNSIFNKLLQADKRGDKVFPFTSGKNKYDFLKVDELIAQVAAAISQSEIAGEINICSGNPVSLADQIEKYIKENNLHIALDYGKYPDRPYDSPCIYGDNRKIKEILAKNNK